MGFRYCDACKHSSLRVNPKGNYECLSKENGEHFYDIDGDESCTGFTENEPSITIVDVGICYTKIENNKFYAGGKDLMGCFWWKEIPKYLFSSLMMFKDDCDKKQ